MCLGTLEERMVVPKEEQSCQEEGGMLYFIVFYFNGECS